MTTAIVASATLILGFLVADQFELPREDANPDPQGTPETPPSATDATPTQEALARIRSNEAAAISRLRSIAAEARLESE